MTAQQKKVKKFKEALEELEQFKIEYHWMHPNASEEEYKKAVEEKAQELDL
jgi:hypothetical protein